jgi:hypothetical protein
MTATSRGGATDSLVTPGERALIASPPVEPGVLVLGVEPSGPVGVCGPMEAGDSIDELRPLP